MVLWAWNQWRLGRKQKSRTRMLAIVLMRAGWRVDNASSHWLVSTVPGMSWAVSQPERRKVFIQPTAASSGLPLSSLAVPMFSFLSWLIDRPPLQCYSYVTQQTLCFWKHGIAGKRKRRCSLCLAPHLSISASCAQNRRIGVELDYIQGQLFGPNSKWLWIWLLVIGLLCHLPRLSALCIHS